MTRTSSLVIALALGLVPGLQPSRAAVALLMEEPYGELGSFDPAGHSAVYLNHICAESPTQLRVCRAGELGVVISRYHMIHTEDWTAIALVPYLYAVEEPSDVPHSVTKADVTRLREAYWCAGTCRTSPPRPDGAVPKGEWTQLVGGSFDRQIHATQVETTAEQGRTLHRHLQ